MQTIKVDDLPTYRPLPCSVLHESGRKMHDIGEFLTVQHLELMHDWGISKVLWLDDEFDDAERLYYDQQHKLVRTKVLLIGETISQPVFRGGKMLLKPGQRVHDDTKKILLSNDIEELNVFKSEDELKLRQFESYKKDVQDKLARYMQADSFLDDSSYWLTNRFALNDTILKRGAERLAKRPVKPSDTPLSGLMRQTDLNRNWTAAETRDLQDTYADLVEKVREFFERIRQGDEVDGDKVKDLILETINLCLSERELLLTQILVPAKEERFLYRHSVGVLVISLVTGLILNLDKRQLYELGFSALFNDLGMELLPPEIVYKAGKLESDEVAVILSHPRVGAESVGNVTKVPAAAPFVIYQTHERSDGTGYPNKVTTAALHTYAKIIGLADFYVALVSYRPYRPAKHPYTAVEAILAQMNAKKFDNAVVAGFLKGVGLYPIGSWVHLNNNAVARVIGFTGNSFNKPIVAVLLQGGKLLSRVVRYNLAKESNLRLAKPAAVTEFLTTDIKRGFVINSLKDS